MTREQIIDNSIQDDSSQLSDKKRLFVQKELKKQANTKANNQTINKGSIAYMSRDNVKKFDEIIRHRIFKIGKPYAFDKIEDLEKELSDYFDTCNKYNILPTVTNCSLWLGCDRDTIYNHANNSNSPYFGVMKNLINYLHDKMQSGTLSGDINPVTYIFLSKNYYGMRDDKNITVSATQGNNINSEETADALRKQIEEEHTPNASLISEE